MKENLPELPQRASRPPRSADGALRMALAVGCLGIGVNYLANALLALPLLPEQVGVLMLRSLPLFVFSAAVQTLGPLARPLLLVGVTLALIALTALGALATDRFVRHGRALALALLVAVPGAGIALASVGPEIRLDQLALEVGLLAGVVALGNWAGQSLTASPAPTQQDRRRFLRTLFLGAVALAALPVAYIDVRRLVTALATKEGTRATTEITPVRDFYVVSKNLAGDPVVDARSWRLSLPNGNALTYEQLLALPAQQLEVTFECISNEIGGTLISNGMWKGPRVRDVLALASTPPDATYLLIESADGYSESLPLAELTDDGLLATHLNGEPLTPVHGFPARLVFPGRYGMKQPKWVTRLKLSADNRPGYWEQIGWDEKAIVKTMSRIDSPLDGSMLLRGTVRISGIAFAGTRRISAVEVSWDGSGGHEAELEREFSPFAWRFWHVDAPLGPGRYTVRVRARDGGGNLQTEAAAPTLPNGASGLHKIVIDVRDA